MFPNTTRQERGHEVRDEEEVFQLAREVSAHQRFNRLRRTVSRAAHSYRSWLELCKSRSATPPVLLQRVASGAGGVDTIESTGYGAGAQLIVARVACAVAAQGLSCAHCDECGAGVRGALMWRVGGRAGVWRCACGTRGCLENILEDIYIYIRVTTGHVQVSGSTRCAGLFLFYLCQDRP